MVRGMTRVRAREDGKLRAAVLALAARLFNFRHWDATGGSTPELLERGGVSVACSVLYRPFSELDLDEPYGAPPESAYYARLVELLDATERRGRARRGTSSCAPRPTSTPRAGKIAFVHCIEGGFHLGATPEEVDRARPRARRPRRALHHARAPVLAPGRDQHARAPVPPRRRLRPALPAAARRSGSHRWARPRCGRCTSTRPGRHQPHARGRDRRDVRADRGARPRDRRATRASTR